MPTNQNIVFILMDALRPNHLGCYGYDKPTSPCIDRIAKDSIKYTQAFATSNCTMPSLVSINTGLHPVQHGVRHVGLPSQNPEFQNLIKMKIQTLPAILKSKGYATGAVDWLGGHLKDGYAYYSSVIRETTVYDSALHTTNAAINFIRENHKTPFFLFLHYWDTHDPYYIDDINLELFKREPTGKMISEVRPHLIQFKDMDTSIIAACYDAAIRNIDKQISRLYDYLDSENLIDTTVLIITADHGESLGEHNIWFTHIGLYDVNLHIPLLIHLPSKQHYFDTTLTLHQDLFPTILQLTGISSSPYYHYGHTLLSKPRGNLPLREQPLTALEGAGFDRETLRYPQWKLIDVPRERESKFWYKETRGLGEPQLYNLKCDPNETNNMAQESASLTKDLQEELQNEIYQIKKEFINARNK